MRKKLNKIILVLMLIFSSLYFFSPDTNALSSISKATTSTVFDSSYGFSYRFISGVTQFSSFGCDNNYSGDDWSTNDSHGYKDEGWHTARITSASQKGKVGAWYKNVGTYQGKIVDLKITVVDWTAIRTVNTSIDGKANYATICFPSNKIAISPTTKCFDNLKVRFEFYEHNTNNKMSIKCHENLYDIDNGEFAILSSSAIAQGYVAPTTGLTYSGSTVKCAEGTNSSNTDTKHWITLLINGSSFDITYDRTQDDINSTTKSRTFFVFGFNAESVAPFDTPYLTKSVNKSQITSTEGFSYSFSTMIPQQPSASKYTSFKITDTLDNALTLSNTSLTVTNDAGQNVSNNFSLSQSGQVITINAGNYVSNNSFYNKSYTFTINVVPKSGYSYNVSSGKANISNSATVTTNRGSRTSNTVNTEVRFRIDTQSTNASITATATGIVGGSDKTISWTANDGYWISSITVDGVSQSVNDYRKGSYTFSGINKDHTVKIVANPCYKITTEAVNGNISSTVTKIDPGSNKTISWTANDGYYVSEVIVDGHAYSYKDYTSQYTFANINGNHHIKVVCEPLKNIVTDINNGTITKTITGIHPDDQNKTIYYKAFEDYYISSVQIDGKEIEVDDFVQGSFEFDDLLEDHTIKVICEPKPIVYTEVKNGNITPGFNVFPHEDGKVTATSLDGYYISRVLINGQRIDDYEEYQMNYTFKDITEDQYVYVECVPIPELHIQKTTDKDTYNYKDTIHYQIKVEQTVENTTSTHVVVRDVLPDNLKIKENSFVITGDDYVIEKTDNGFKVVFDEIGYDQNIIIEFDAELLDKELVGKSITNTAYAICDHVDDEVSDSVTNEVLRPQLSIDKSANKEAYNYKDTIYYKVSINQDVEGAVATDVVLTDTLNDGLSLDMDSFDIVGVHKDDYVIEKTDDGFIMKINKIEDECVVTYKAVVTDSILAGNTVMNIATVTASNNTDVIESSVVSPILLPVFEITKTTDKEKYNYKDTIHYTVKTSQLTKNAKAFDVVLNDTYINEGIDFDYSSVEVTGASEEDYSIEEKGNGYLINFIKPLSDEEIIVEYDGVINDESLAGKEIKHEVYISCANNPHIISWEDHVVHEVLKPQWELSKVADKIEAYKEDVIHYNVNATQLVKNAKSFDIDIADEMENNQELIEESIHIEGLAEDKYKIISSNTGFIIHIDELEEEQNLIIEYDTRIIDDAQKTSVNKVTLTDRYNNLTSSTKLTIEERQLVVATSDKTVLTGWTVTFVISVYTIFKFKGRKVKKWI